MKSSEWPTEPKRGRHLLAKLDRFIHGLLFGWVIALWTAVIVAFARTGPGPEAAMFGGVTFTAGLIAIGSVWNRPLRVAAPSSEPGHPPELPSQDVVLWRLRWTPDRLLSCIVGVSADDLALKIHEQASGVETVAEMHPTIGSLVSRAESLRDKFVTAGWEDVDYDPYEPD